MTLPAVHLPQTQTRRRLLQDCMACQRPFGQPMCDLCAELEQAEETASERRDDNADD